MKELQRLEKNIDELKLEKSSQREVAQITGVGMAVYDKMTAQVIEKY